MRTSLTGKFRSERRGAAAPRAVDLATQIAEADPNEQVELERGGLPAAVVASLASALDLPRTRLFELNPAWNAIPSGLISEAAGAKWFESRRSALLLVPSVIAPEEWWVLVNPEHPDLSAHGHRGDIAISNRRERRNGPPRSRGNASKRVGLSVMLHEVEHGRGNDQQNDDAEPRDRKLFLLARQRTTKTPQRPRIAGEFQHAKNSHEASRARTPKIDAAK